MTALLDFMIEKAQAAPQRIVLPETEEDDILRLAARISETGIGTPHLIGNPSAIRSRAEALGLSSNGFAFFDNEAEEDLEKLGQACEAAGGFKAGIVKRKASDSLTCAMLLLAAEMVDGVAAGKACPTGDVVLEAISIIGLDDGISNPSSMGIADIPGSSGPEGSMLAVADCAITAQPNAEELASIAIASANTVSALLGWEPRIALLAFSTCGSAEHESIDVVRAALEIVREKAPDLNCDGELQLDAAIDMNIAKHKVPHESNVAGKANVLVFPNLHAGNIGVKLIQQFAHANVYGPILQGFRKLVCDFSRSAPVDEMLGNIAMLAVRAANA